MKAIERPQLLMGILLVALGGLILLSNLNILRGFSLWAALWGVFWLWLGGVVMGWLPRRSSAWADGSSIGSGRMALGLTLLAIGAITLADGIGLIGFSAGDVISRLWPLILIGLGAAVLFGSRGEASARMSTAAAGDRIEYDTIFGDLKLTRPGWQLKDVRVFTVVGDVKIDLAKARIPDGETRIDVRAVIGDIDIWAPPDLPVALDAQCALASVHLFGRKQDVAFRRFTDAPPGYDTAPRRVRVCADLILGDLNLSRAG